LNLESESEWQNCSGELENVRSERHRLLQLWEGTKSELDEKMERQRGELELSGGV